MRSSIILLSSALGAVCAAGGSAHAQAEPASLQGVYLYSTPVSQENGGQPTGSEAQPIAFTKGSLTDGNPERAVLWQGKAGAPRTMSVVFDLLADVPLQQINLHTRRSNQHQRTDSVAVHVRSAQDESYRVALFEREGIREPWEKLEIPVSAEQPVRYVKVIFNRRHSFVNTPLSQVEFIPAAATGSGSAAATTAATAPTAETLAAEFAIDAALVDRFGQYLYEPWGGKIKSEADFRRDLSAEQSALQASRSAAGTPFTARADGAEKIAAADVFASPTELAASVLSASPGVLPETLEATGFFRLERINGRWWFITPEGRPWFMNGVCVTDPKEGGYSTSLTDNEGQERGVFTELPAISLYPDAYTTERGNERVNFLIANLRAKYGQGDAAAARWQQQWTSHMQERLRQWGFNANAKWTRATSLELPFITVLRPDPQTPRILYAVDPFDPHFAANVERGVAAVLEQHRDDPLIIGHTFESEKGWDFDVVSAMLRDTGTLPAKAAFIDYLRQQHGAPETSAQARSNWLRLLGLPAETAPEGLTAQALLGTPLKLTEALHADARAFIHLAGQRYYSIAVPIIRKYDPNHLILGSSLTPGWHSSYEWEVAAVGYVDALSFDYYVSDPAWIDPYLKYDIPILLLEYSFVVGGRGLPGFHTTVSTQRERGLYYRQFIEQLAALPQFVGAGWFLLYDQPVTGRNPGGGGECHNFGLINQQDQPYEEMLEEVQKTSRRLYDIHAGMLKPFTMD